MHIYTHVLILWFNRIRLFLSLFGVDQMTVERGGALKESKDDN